MTGKAPSTHGIHDFFKPHSFDDVQLIDSTSIKAQTIWELLSQAQRSVGSINVPVTFPARAVNGYMIPGVLAPDPSVSCYPKQLLSGLSARLGAYWTAPKTQYRPNNPQPFIDELNSITRQQIKYAKHLIQAQPTDITMLHFQATDMLQHKLWHTMSAAHPWHTAALGKRYGNTIRELYQLIDSGIAELVGLLPSDATILVLSDHGFGPQHNTVNLNLLLADAGLLTLKPSAKIKRRINQQHLGTAVAQRLLRQQKLLTFADVDWSQTLAYSRGHLGQLYVNLRDRQAQGCVDSADYDTTLARIAEALNTLCDPQTNRPLPVTVSRAADQPPPHGPDLHVCIDDYRSVAYPMFAADGNLFTEQRMVDSGNHRANGILLASGVAVRSDSRITGARLIDLAPTILHLCGAGIPDDLDGAVLTELLNKQFLANNPVQYRTAEDYAGANSAEMNFDEQAIIANRLRNLGYLDQ